MAKSDTVSKGIDWRAYHTSEVLGDELFIWGGNQSGIPLRHDHEDKKSILTKLDVLNLPTMEWDKVTTTGTPPTAALDYSTTTIGEDLYLFGGRCDPFGYCCHNDLFCLNTTNKVWSTIPTANNTATSTGLMKKCCCGLTSWSYQGSDYLLTLGGMGGKQLPTQLNCYINEVHTMNITMSPGIWISPSVTGDRPPPLARFTINVLPDDRSMAVVFGGIIMSGMFKCSNDVYNMSLTEDTVNFTKLSPQSALQWPEPRQSHSSVIISNETDNYLLIVGGGDVSFKVIADCWMMNMTTKKWSQINLPRSVCERRSHSMSSITINSNTHWIIVTGGFDKDYKMIMGDNVAMIVEMEYVTDDLKWEICGVWNSTQTEELKQRIKKRRPTTQQQQQQQQKESELQEKVEELTQLLQQKDIVIEQKDSVVRRYVIINDELQKQLGGKEDIIQQKDVVTQQLNHRVQEQEEVNQRHMITIDELQKQLGGKEDIILQKDVVTQQLNLQIQQQQEVIQRKERIITEMQQEMTLHHDNPHWLIRKEEVQMTQEVLGTGAWGEVKVGVFRGTKVAVKCLHNLIISAHYLQLFSREMEIASHIRHPNLLQFIGATRVGNPLMLTEVMPTSLRKELEKCPMTKPQVVSISIDITSALNYLHLWKPRPMLHRDVSSANVLLQPSGNTRWIAKLSDYGSVVNLLDNINTENPGCPVYSAPEANTPSEHSPGMDVYSFAILMIEMSTGQFPSSVSSKREIEIQSIKWLPIKDLIVRCTTDKPSLRPSTSRVLEYLKNI